MSNARLRRLLGGLVVFFAMSWCIFLLPSLMGIDPALAIARARIGERSLDAVTVANLRSELGLDRPLVIQYLSWLTGIAQGNLGVSYVSRAPVGKILAHGLRVTSLLTVVTLLLAFGLSLPLAVLAARRPGSWLDLLITSGCQVGVAMPPYVLGPLLVLVFALWLRWLPSTGWDGPRFLVLPVLTLLPAPLAYFTQATRAALLDVYQADYMRTARAKGLGNGALLYRHALRNALIPAVALAALWLAGLLGGAVIVEVIFAVPGLGRILYDAAISGDLPLLQAGLLFLAVLAMFINMLTDAICEWLNPAIRK